MGQIADALRNNLRSWRNRMPAACGSSIRSCAHCRTAKASSQPTLGQRPDVQALLGSGSFQRQTVATLKRLCKRTASKAFQTA